MSDYKDVWKKFDTVYCLNQASRPDRWAQAESEFSRVQLANVKRFLSLPAGQPIQSFCLSQYALLKTFLSTKATTLLALEDDVVFRELHVLPKALVELPSDWDILYLGANITEGVFGIRENPPVRHSEHLYRVRRAWTSHAITYTREAAQRIVTVYDPNTCGMYDEFVSSHMLEKMKAYLVNPMVAFQRPGISDLWGGRATDYTGAFEMGNKIMSA